MDETTRARIFDRFYTVKEVGKGTGLALSAVYGIVKQYEGYVQVDSAVGMGPTFRVHFPVVDTMSKNVDVSEQEMFCSEARSAPTGSAP